MIRTLASAAALLLAAGAAPVAMAHPSDTPAAATSSTPGFATSDATDPYLWLEEVEGARAMDWVKAHNEHSLGTLQGDPRYEGLHQQALDIVQSRDRIPSPGFTHDGHVDNFWQDAEHVRGIWRRTTLDSYRTATPTWETILDIDALSAAEGANWVYKGATCTAPEERYCLLSLSNGGKDAVTIREFDSVTKTFVEGGISLPESKGGASWIDKDTLLISRDFGEGSLTDSGYPRTVRLMKRGQSVDQAVEVFAGQQTDVSVSGYTLRDADGVVQAVLLNRGINFYESETSAPERRRHDDSAGPAAQGQHQRPGQWADGGDHGRGLDRAFGSGIQDRRRHRLAASGLAGRSQDARPTGHSSRRARGDRGHQRHPQPTGRGPL